jgi:hypothetical protein
MAKVLPLLDMLHLLILDSWSAPRARRGPPIYQVTPPHPEANTSQIRDLLLPVGWHKKVGTGAMGYGMMRRGHFEEMAKYIILPSKGGENKGSIYGFPCSMGKCRVGWSHSGIGKYWYQPWLLCSMVECYQ